MTTKRAQFANDDARLAAYLEALDELTIRFGLTVSGPSPGADLMDFDTGRRFAFGLDLTNWHPGEPIGPNVYHDATLDSATADWPDERPLAPR